MTLRNSFHWPLAVLLVMGIIACGGGGGPFTQDDGVDTLAVVAEGDGVVKVGNRMFSVPSPVQTMLLIQELKTPYMNSLALSTDSITRFVTKEKQALALGIYGADLAYATTYQDGQRAMKTMKAVEELASKLNLSNAFDKNLLASFQKNINNKDSLLRLTGKAFRAADMYLKNDQREDVSAGVLAGGWIESLYLGLSAMGDQVDPRMAIRLAEQRHTLDNLITLLVQDPASGELVVQLRDLAETYKGITLEYTFVEPTQDMANKTTYINSTSKAQIAPGTLQEIIEKVQAIRAAIIA